MKIGKLLLYHGSNMVVDCPKWNHGSRYRDFGQCFYTTHSREMARDWAEKMSLVNPVVNGYALDFRSVETCDLRIKRFRADAEWAEFIYNNRFNSTFCRPEYDIIVGPVADRGLTEQFSRIDNEGLSFDDIAPLINYSRYKDVQICFCSEYSVKLLKRIDL
ncbi:MAG: DUF3990 domain-containing protein [Prevotella sp.]|nr:DUF3990 domain-containing protein [Prevotella sp.]